jgi:hypothetical protein
MAMYHNCIFCSAKLGSNDSIEHFPVGKTLAFDSGKGRLWAVCPKCARWNLAPIEERWEAIDEAERQFRDSRMRAHSENVGLAKLRDGTRLVRVGKALPVELASMRYGKAYQRRHALHTSASVALGTAGAVGAIVFAPALVTIAAVASVVIVSSVGVVGILGLPAQRLILNKDGLPRPWALRLANRLVERRRRREHPPAGAHVAEWVQAPIPGARIPLSRAQLAGARLTPSNAGPLAVHLPALDLHLEGWHAQSLAARRLIHLNRAGGDAQDLAASVKTIASLGGPAGYLDRAARQGLQIGPDAAHHGVQALALELALHEETERRAMEGELASLESMWREAEEIASIADRLPDGLAPPEPPRLGTEG